MAYTEQELVQMVVAKIDQIMPPGENIEGGTTIDSPVPYIEKELKESGYHVLRQAPDVQIKQVIKKATKHFPVGSTNPDTPATNPNTRIIFAGGITKIPLPTDFLRFIDIQLENWLVPVSGLMKQTDPKYIREKSIPMLRGTEIKPKAALVSFSDYIGEEIVAGFQNVGLAVECFSNKVEPTTFTLHYVPKTAPTAIPEDLIDAMLWECAGRTFVLMNKKDRAEQAFNQVNRYFSNKYGLYGEDR
jgi:hypothetical protein